MAGSEPALAPQRPRAPAPPVTVLVVDDHPVVGDGVATIVRGCGIAVVGVAENVTSARAAAARLRPDVILLDLRLGDAIASDAVGALREASPRSRIVVFTAFPDHPAVAAAVAAGAAGCLLKDVARTDLVTGIKAVAAGGSLAPAVRADAAHAAARALSPREYEILRAVARGQTNAEIAATLYLAPATVKTYWQSALRKLRARNRAEAITKAHTEGLL